MTGICAFSNVDNLFLQTFRRVKQYFIWFQSANLQINQLPNCPITKLLNCQIAELSNCRIVKLPNYQIAELSNCQIVKSEIQNQFYLCGLCNKAIWTD